MKSFTINSKHGKFKVLVDNEDYTKVINHKWNISKSSNKYFRVECNEPGFKVRLHRFILGLNVGDPEVDHINRNPLDNRKNNLRIVNRTAQVRNTSSRQNSISKYVGVSFDKKNKKWVAQLKINNKIVYYKRFDNELDAAKNRDKAAKKYHGEFASLNFKD